MLHRFARRRIASGAAAAALGLTVVLGATACSAGQITQTADKAPSINGANAEVTHADTDGTNINLGFIALRDVQLLYPADAADTVWGDGGPFELSFVVTNDSSVMKARLADVTVEQGTVTFTPPLDPALTDNELGKRVAKNNLLAPNEAMYVGCPAYTLQATDGPLTAEDYSTDPTVCFSDSEVNDDTIEVNRLRATLSGAGDTVAPGLTVPMTFTFESLDLNNKVLETSDVTVPVPVDATNTQERADIPRSGEPDYYSQVQGH